jgi:hypothetical protein
MKAIISSLLVKIFIKKSKIISNEKIGEKFSLLTIAFPKKRTWIAGDKIQIKISSSSMRSYTPINFKDEKIFTTLIYLPLKGPGTNWANQVKANQKVEIYGPRHSLQLANEKEYIFFGDETSIGLYIALKEHFKIVDYLFEVHSKNEVEQVIKYYCLDDSKFHESSIDVSKENLAHILSTYTDKTFILSGNKQSIEILSKLLYEKGLSQILKRPYWGKR